MGAIATKRNILFLSLLLALFTSLLVYRFLQDQKHKAMVAKVPVVVANTDIEARKIISAGEVGIRMVPADQVRGQVCSREEDVVGKAALVKISPNTLITPADVGEANIKLGLAYVIPSNMRAMTVGINDESGVAGFLKPRDHVDVIGAFESDGKATAKTVLQNVELLALGTEVEQEKVSKNSGKARPEKKTTATLIVTPKDAEKLVLSGTLGKLTLVLRPPDDIVKVATTGATGPSITGIQPRERSYSSPAASSAPSPAPRPIPTIWNHSTDRPAAWGSRPIAPSTTLTPKPIEEPKREIQVIRGNKVETVEVENRDSAPKTNKEESGTGPVSRLWLTNGQ